MKISFLMFHSNQCIIKSLTAQKPKHKGHMMTEKTVNYTPEQTQELVQAYASGQTVENLAMQLGRSTRSIVAKLSREGVYKAKSKASGVARVKKADLVDQIAMRCGVAPELFDSLEKANHEVLEALVANLR
jgi:transposase-like protein